MSIAANVAITGRLIGCIDSRDTTITSGIYMTLFPRVTCPAQCCIARHYCIVSTVMPSRVAPHLHSVSACSAGCQAASMHGAAFCLAAAAAATDPLKLAEKFAG